MVSYHGIYQINGSPLRLILNNLKQLNLPLDREKCLSLVDGQKIHLPIVLLAVNTSLCSTRVYYEHIDRWKGITYKGDC